MKDIDRNVVIHGRNALSSQAADAFFLKSGSWRKLVFTYVSSQGVNGATDQEIQAYLDKSGDTIRPARKTLQDDKLIVDSGRTRKNAAGNDCTVWITYEYEGQLF
jgi:hypothetical protein